VRGNGPALAAARLLRPRRQPRALRPQPVRPPGPRALTAAGRCPQTPCHLPGMTKTINHFLINDSWYLVDLPGYG
jgi:hypothetical protein